MPRLLILPILVLLVGCGGVPVAQVQPTQTARVVVITATVPPATPTAATASREELAAYLDRGTLLITSSASTMNAFTGLITEATTDLTLLNSPVWEAMVEVHLAEFDRIAAELASLTPVPSGAEELDAIYKGQATALLGVAQQSRRAIAGDSQGWNEAITHLNTVTDLSTKGVSIIQAMQP